MNNANDETNGQDLVASALSARSLRAQTEKTDYLDLLLRSLDVLIFLEIGILYCCDNLSLLLAIRAICQLLWVQAAPHGLAPISLAPTIVGNLVCLITHIVHDRPSATARSARGWIHGGLLVDFVGELGPVSRWRLLGYDILIAALQILMLMIGHEKRRALGEDKAEEAVPQDIEAEEAGIRKSEEGRDDAAAVEDGIEMDRLLPSGSREDASSSSRSQPDDGLIATINVKQTLRALVRPSTSATQSTPAPNDPDERAARMRAILGRLIADRLRPSS